MPDNGDLTLSTPECSGEGSEVDLAIEGLAAGGRGVARPGGRVWFVPGAFPGDHVRAAAVRAHPRFVEGRLVALSRPSPDRRPAPCPVQGRCGGCPWMPLEEAIQREWKGRLVRDALGRIGGVDEGVVEPVRSGERALAYRGRVELALGRDPSGRTVLGFHGAEPGAGLVDVERCLLQSEPANRVLQSLREFLLARPALWTKAPGTAPFRLTLRASPAGEVSIALRETHVPFPEAEALARWIGERHPEVRNVARVRAVPGRRGGARTIPLAGSDFSEEHVGGFTFRVPLTGFTQVNLDWTARLPELVRETAGEVLRRDVLDLYGGIGVHGLELARAGARSVVVCEADAAAVRCGRAATRLAGLGGVRFVRADVARFLARHAVAGRARELLAVANPPRAGMGVAVSRALAALPVTRLVLVSCDPPTLARDVRILVERGFRLRRAIPVDLFPQTPHVETVALLERAAGASVSAGRGASGRRAS